MNKLGLNSKEEIQIKTISEYLFFDEYKDYVTYNRLNNASSLYLIIFQSLWIKFSNIYVVKRENT